MKTKEELNALKAEVDALSAKLAELTEEELSVVTGGNVFPIFGGTVIEVGKWYKAPDNYQYEFFMPNQSKCRWYCAEYIGGNSFRFERYVWAPLSSGNGVSYQGDSVSNGGALVECPAPFPLPANFTVNL